MGLIEYRESRPLEAHSFRALIMAAMRRADTKNLEKLQTAFPDVWTELVQRYNAPGGCLNDREMEWLKRVIEEENGGEK